MAPNQAYFFDGFTTLDLETEESTPTSTPVAGITGVTVVPNVTIEHLFTGDSIKASTRKQHEFMVDVSVEYAKWDPVVARQWLGGSGGSAASGMADTTDPQRYQLDMDFEGASGNTLNASVRDITFEEMPIVEGSNGEYLSWSLDGTGEDIESVDTT